MWRAIPTCRALLRHAIRLALPLALLRAGNNIAAKTAMMAITTSNSIKVKACLAPCVFEDVQFTITATGDSHQPLRQMLTQLLAECITADL